MRLKNKKAIITGGGTGIGRAITERFCKEGAQVIIADRGSGKKTAEQIPGSTFYETDVSDENSINETISKLDEIDIVVNNAGAFIFGSIENVSTEDWTKAINVNILGYANTIKVALPYLKESNSGAIVNIASISSFKAQPNFLPYSTSKGAILQLTKCLALDLGCYNIRVNSVSPGTICTDAIKKTMNTFGIDYNEGIKKLSQETIMKRIGTPDEVANGVLFLASEEASYITGTNLIIDGGASI